MAAIILVAIIGAIIYYFISRSQNDSTFSVLDKKGIEDNKSQIIDIAVLNNLPVFGYEGKGVFFQFIDDFEKETGLEFNKVPYEVGSTPSLDEYTFKVLGTSAKLKNNQIVIYDDSYILLSKTNKKFDSINDITGLTVGTMKDDISSVSYFLTNNNKLTYKPYDNNTALFQALDTNEIGLIAIPYNLYINQIVANNNYYIVFHLNEINKRYVLELSDDNDHLNSIVTKYFNKWYSENYQEIYNNYLFNLYLTSRNIDSVTRNAFQGKVYTYGLVDNLPYEMVLNGKLIGINGEYLNLFSDITGVEFKYLKYANLEDLIKAVDEDKVDVSFNYYNIPTSVGYVKTLSPFDEEYVLLAYNNKDLYINSLKSLKGYTVSVLKNTLLDSYIKDFNNVNTIEYATLDSLLNNVNKDSIILLDNNTYQQYKNNKFNYFKVIYRDNLSQDYTFLIKDNKANKTFIDIFGKFISTVNYKELVNSANLKLLDNPVRQNIFETLSKYLLLIVVIVFFFVRFSVGLFNKKKIRKKLKKEEKIRYTDMLTSLKNRNYLNDNIERWEENNTFPQALVIVDLNNVKYVNDNFGHEEGDSLIKKAASILINTQLENSEIMRTDGNEFLIYLVGYSETQIVSYTRRLYKELKNLPHEFGAALGFSMIEDEIKTIDDAINEAALDMRTNKEGQKE